MCLYVSKWTVCALRSPHSQWQTKEPPHRLLRRVRVCNSKTSSSRLRILKMYFFAVNQDLNKTSHRRPTMYICSLKRKGLKMTDFMLLFSFASRQTQLERLLLTPHQSWFDKNLMWNFFGPRCQNSSFLPLFVPGMPNKASLPALLNFGGLRCEWRSASRHLALTERMREGKKKKCDVCVFALLTWSPFRTIKCMTSSGFSPSSPFFFSLSSVFPLIFSLSCLFFLSHSLCNSVETVNLCPVRRKRFPFSTPGHSCYVSPTVSINPTVSALLLVCLHKETKWPKMVIYQFSAAVAIAGF